MSDETEPIRRSAAVIVRVCICIYINIHTYTYTYIYTYICMNMYIHLYIFNYIYVYWDIFRYKYICIYMYINTYTDIYSCWTHHVGRDRADAPERRRDLVLLQRLKRQPLPKLSSSTFGDEMMPHGSTRPPLEALHAWILSAWKSDGTSHVIRYFFNGSNDSPCQSQLRQLSW